jgi:hypothetical protein
MFRTTMEEIKSKNRDIGHHWFEADTMRFFRSRIPQTTVDGWNLFVTSEQFDEDSPRLYTIRVANKDGSIDTMGDFQAFGTRAQAVAAARRLLAGESIEATLTH